MKKRIPVAVAFLTCFSASAVAADLFRLRIEVGGVESKTFSFDNVEEAIDQFEQENFDAEFSSYTDTSTAMAELDFRGLDMRLSFVDTTSKLVLEVPSIGIRETFTGADRDGSVDELEEFLKDQGSDILNRIQAALIAQSPVDPIAGNPGSMMGSMVSRQFELGFSDQVTSLGPESGGAPAAEDGPADADVVSGNPDNLIHIAPRFGRLTSGGRTSRIITLPLGYSFRLKEGSATGLRSVDLSLPISWADVEGGESYALSFNTGLTWGMSERWSLSPAAGAGLAGSRDLGAAGGVGSISLTSAVSFPLRVYQLNVGNMVGFYRTLDVKIGKYSFDPGVSNTVLRNGLMVSRSRKVGKRDVVTEFWLTDTRFFGSDLFSEYYDEFGISLGTSRAKEGKRSIRNWLRGGVSYLTGDGVDGWRVNLGFRF